MRLLFETKEKFNKIINDLKQFHIKTNPSSRKSYYGTHPELLQELKNC